MYEISDIYKCTHSFTHCYEGRWYQRTVYKYTALYGVFIEIPGYFYEYNVCCMLEVSGSLYTLVEPVNGYITSERQTRIVMM